MDHALL
jgi:hypothetical protein